MSENLTIEEIIAHLIFNERIRNKYHSQFQIDKLQAISIKRPYSGNIIQKYYFE